MYVLHDLMYYVHCTEGNVLRVKIKTADNKKFYQKTGKSVVLNILHNFPVHCYVCRGLVQFLQSGLKILMRIQKNMTRTIQILCKMYVSNSLRTS